MATGRGGLRFDFSSTSAIANILKQSEPKPKPKPAPRRRSSGGTTRIIRETIIQEVPVFIEPTPAPIQVQEAPQDPFANPKFQAKTIGRQLGRGTIAERRLERAGRRISPTGRFLGRVR